MENILGVGEKMKSIQEVLTKVYANLLQRAEEVEEND